MPSLDALRAFEVAARRLSFTKAAQELCVTQGAVSQRIKSLEIDLGGALFHRRATGLALTHSGERLANGVREAVALIYAAMDDDAAPRPLKVSVLPSFAFCWMVPRLHRLAKQHASMRVEVLAQGEVVDLHDTGIDLAIRFGPGQPGGLASQRLMGDSVVPVCAPSLFTALGCPQHPDDLCGAPILRDSPTEQDGSGSDWASWLAKVGAPHVRLEPGQRFNQADLLIEAAARGLGVALARTSLIGEHLVAGRLRRLPMPSVTTNYAYHLIWRADTAAPTARLRAWLLAEAASEKSRSTELPRQEAA